MLKLDLKDRKLLYYLSVNGRATDTQLSKQVGLSKNAIKYRIERLQEEKIITHFSCVVNLGSVGYTTFTIMIRFNEDVGDNQSLLQYFIDHPFAGWVVTLSGKWDIFVEFICRDIAHYEEIIKGMLAQFGKRINTYQVYFSKDTLRVEHLISDFYKDLKVEEIEQKPRTTNKVILDEVDSQILHELVFNSALPYLELARRLSLTIDIVRYRIKELHEKQVLVKFFPEISLPKLGYTEYVVILKIHNPTHELVTQLRKSISVNNSITYAFMDSASLRISFVCAFRTPSEMDQLIRILRKQYVDILEDVEYMIVTKQILFTLFPKGLVINKNGKKE